MKKLLVILLLFFPVHSAWADYDIDVNPGGRFKEGIGRRRSAARREGLGAERSTHH